MESVAAAVGRHFSRSIAWFESDAEGDRVQRGGAGRALSLAVDLANGLTAVDLSVPAAPIVQWACSSRWRIFHYSYERRAREMVAPWGGMLIELPHWALLEDGESPGVETSTWPEDWSGGRPSCFALIKQGMVTEAWIAFLQELVAAFSQLSSDCQRLPASVPEARCLLTRASLLASDLLYVCRMNGFAWFLHRSGDMPPHFPQIDNVLLW